MPADAFAQFKDTEIWRKQNDLEALYEKIDINDYWESRSVVSWKQLALVRDLKLMSGTVSTVDGPT